MFFSVFFYSPCNSPALVLCVIHVVLVILPILVVFAIIVVIAHAIYSISRSFASCPHCLGRDGSEGILCRPCSEAGERTHVGF